MPSKINLFSKKDKAPREEVALNILKKAHKDWKMLLLGAFVLAVIVVGSEAYLLWRVNTGDIFTTEMIPETDTTITDKKALSNTVKFFDDRAADFETFKNTPRTEIDPSL
jgi:predicted ATP-grasp superfamily ATP-dependent carboligase